MGKKFNQASEKVAETAEAMRKHEATKRDMREALHDMWVAAQDDKDNK